MLDRAAPKRDRSEVKLGSRGRYVGGSDAFRIGRASRLIGATNSGRSTAGPFEWSGRGSDRPRCCGRIEWPTVRLARAPHPGSTAGTALPRSTARAALPRSTARAALPRSTARTARLDRAPQPPPPTRPSNQPRPSQPTQSPATRRTASHTATYLPTPPRTPPTSPSRWATPQETGWASPGVLRQDGRHEFVSPTLQSIRCALGARRPTTRRSLSRSAEFDSSLERSCKNHVSW